MCRSQVLLRLDVMGVGDLLTNLGACCKPVNGDAIIGYVTRGRGITVHRADCVNVLNRNDPERLVDVTWGTKNGETFPVGIRVKAWDRVGLLKDVSTLLADEKVNILYVQTTTNDDRTVNLYVTIEVENVGQLSRILNKIEECAGGRRSATRYLQLGGPARRRLTAERAKWPRHPSASAKR